MKLSTDNFARYIQKLAKVDGETVEKMAFPQSHQQELIELAEITGISAVPGVFR